MKYIVEKRNGVKHYIDANQREANDTTSQIITIKNPLQYAEKLVQSGKFLRDTDPLPVSIEDGTLIINSMREKLINDQEEFAKNQEDLAKKQAEFEREKAEFFAKQNEENESDVFVKKGKK